MQPYLSRANRLLQAPLDLWPRLLMLAAAAALVATFFLPLWNLTMFAPQYPEGLRLDIYAFEPGPEIDPRMFEDIIGRHFRQPKEGLGFDGSPVAHMWRSMIWPNNFL